jgi:hypothetical protein
MQAVCPTQGACPPPTAAQQEETKARIAAVEARETCIDKLLDRHPKANAVAEVIYDALTWVAIGVESGEFLEGGLARLMRGPTVETEAPPPGNDGPSSSPGASEPPAPPQVNVEGPATSPPATGQAAPPALPPAAPTNPKRVIPLPAAPPAAQGAGAPVARFVVTPSGVAVPTKPAELRANVATLSEVSTSPTTSRKFTGVDSKGPLRVRVEKAHPEDPNFTGTPDPLHVVDHLHIDRRVNGLTGAWGSDEKVQYDWPFH